jgi:hypothetical protein
MGPAANLIFLPWTRQGAASAITTTDTLTTQAGSATLTAAVQVNTEDPVQTSVRLLGPADVAGIGARAIVRREPPPRSVAFEDNHFAAIEFDRPDFPWLFTPAKADASSRLRSWLCLIVVRQQEGVRLMAGSDTSLARLDITAPAQAHHELPDLAECWLWAHAQVAGPKDADTDALKNTLAGDPDLSLSRLICPRVLEPNTDYVACVVPTFEAGRLAGLGLPADINAPLAPAWATASNAVTLPLYDYWIFRTGSGGDFKTLVQKLRAKPAPDGLGKRAVDISRAGLDLPTALPVPTPLDLEGALQPLSSAPPSWPPDVEEPFQATLAPIVNGKAATADADPLLEPPLYGRWHAAREEAALGGATWFDEINLDPRHRTVAAFGTQVVQKHQEALMASAWQQAGDLRLANERVRRLQLSLVVSTSLHFRHINRMKADALLRVAAPALTRIPAAASAGVTGAPTLVSAFEGSKVPLMSVKPAMRKLSRERGPLNRRTTRAMPASVGMKGFLVQLNLATLTAVTGPGPGMASFNAMHQAPGLSTLRRYADVTADAVAAMPGAPQFQLMPEGRRIPMPITGVRVAAVDNPVATAFRAAASAHLQKLNPARPWISIFIAPRAMPLEDVRAELRLKLEPKKTLAALARTVVVRGAGTPPGDDAATDPIMYAPSFPQPMYAALRDISQESLLPGLDKVLENSVVGLQTNERFVNAYLVGLNFEMGRELLWRGYPTDQRGTYFNRFWDASDANADPDIPPIHEWGTRPLVDAAGTTPGKFVMLLRSELLQRYPTASIYAVPATRVNGQRQPSADADAEIEPLFRGSLPPDVTFIGFKLTREQITAGEGYFIVIQEQPTEPRFGIDSGIAPAGEYLATASGPPAGVTTGELQWRQNGAHMAGILRRVPMRIAIHVSKFIAPDAPA